MPSLLTALLLAAGSASGQSFSLDDNPDAPLTSPPFAGLFSAEDPFGLMLPAVPMGRIGPSPTLITPSGVTFIDGDILNTVPMLGEPVIDVFSPSRGYLDALSSDKERITPDQSQTLNIRFSVDRATTGLPGTPLAGQAGLRQQPGDIYLSLRGFPHPGFFVGTLGAGPFAGLLPTAVIGAPGMHRLEFDESSLFLTAGMGPGVFVPPGMPAPAITPGSHDNVDALNIDPDPRLDRDGDGVTDEEIYFSINPAEAFVAGFSAADILAVLAGSPGPFPAPWAPAALMGLDSLGFPPNSQLDLFDDIDGLVVWNIGPALQDNFVQAQPGRDFALFSLSETSASIAAIRAMGLPVDGSTIFFTDFSGAFAVYLFGSQVGVADVTSGFDIGFNIDALEIRPIDCDPCQRADVNGDGLVTPADFSAWVAAFNAGNIAADQNCDGLVTPADFSAFVANFNACI
jgi:hypothetical protein